MMEPSENSLEWLYKKENIIEDNMIQILWSLGVDSSVKTDKKSLPYKETFKTTLYRSKPLSNSFYYKPIYKEFIHHVLNMGYRKIRFYCELIQMDPQTEIWTIENQQIPLTIKPNYKCLIKYYIHY